MTSLLKRAWRKAAGRPRLDHLTFTVYTREQCCCCHKAIDLLESYRERHGFRIETVDVDSDPALAEAHGQSVPVVTLGGKVRFRGVVNPALLERLLTAEARPGGDGGEASHVDGDA